MHQHNKPFKSKHSTKSSIKRRNKGRVSKSSSSSSRTISSTTKSNRKNAAKLNAIKKRNALLESRRDLLRNCLVLSMSNDISVQSALNTLLDSSDEMQTDGRLKTLKKNGLLLQFIDIERPSPGNEEGYTFDIIDCARASDCCLFLVSAIEEVDELALNILSTLRASGLPHPSVAVVNLPDSDNSKSILNSLTSWARYQFNGNQKVYDLKKKSDVDSLLHSFLNTKVRRDGIVADQIDYCDGLFTIVGHGKLVPGRLLSFPNFGDFPIKELKLDNEIVDLPDEVQAIPPECCSEAASIDNTQEMLMVEDDSMRDSVDASAHEELESTGISEDFEEGDSDFMDEDQNDEEYEKELQFPDEIDTLPNARHRLRNYRAIESLNADWNEETPTSYDNIYQFEDFKAIQSNVKKSMLEEVSVSGRLTIVLENVSLSMFKYYQKSPCVFFQLKEHEEKMSVLNFTMSRSKNSDEVLKSKDEIIIQSGHRRIRHRPIYSYLNEGKSLNKMVKLVQPGDSVIATVFAPVQYFPCSVLYFLNGKIVGTGALHSVNPNYAIVKRKVLTGIPTKIHPSKHKHIAVIRYMFSNSDDVDYFSPVELTSKNGRRGNILCSLGTHGAMKCRFDKKLTSDDIIMMCLWKRVYPIWPLFGYNSLYQRIDNK